ncbi:MAG: hypothetical protein EP305_05135 [Bacteroidetes bacterium]|nr:MAG: hypothetical protein EP305_05135 [Bacteroidota bacterium]
MITEVFGNIIPSRGFSGQAVEADYFETCLNGDVFNSMVDIETTNDLLQDLRDLATTGFGSAHLMADIQNLENPTPDDIRTWRIGEAFAEVVLENHFSCRFHWNELRDARNPKGNKTGADLVGFIEFEGDVLFLFGEVKTSSETNNAPPQVMTKSDGVENQLRGLYTDNRKRQNLISYLKSKTLTLDPNHPFKLDFGRALVSYYNVDNRYQLIGVLVRDVDPRITDVEISYNRISQEILEPTGLKLVALYTSVSQSEWQNIIRNRS